MSGKLILVVEDDQSTLELIGSILKKAGYETKLANTAQKALKWLKTHTPSLIFLDYMLPDLNGTQFLDKLKKNDTFELYKDVPVILLTAFLDLENEMEKLLVEGVSAYLFKPFARSELLQIVDNVLTTNQIKNQYHSLERSINQIHRLEDDPYFFLPFSVLYLDKNLFVKNMNPKAIEEFGGILDEMNDVPLPTMLERNAVHSSRELQKILYNFSSSAVSYMDFFYTPTGVQQAQVTVLESQHQFMEHQYVIIIDFLKRNLKTPDEIWDLVSLLELFPLGILVLDSRFTLLHANQMAKELLDMSSTGDSAGFFKSHCLPLLSEPIEYVLQKKNSYFLQQHKLLPDSEKVFDIVLLWVDKKEVQLIVLFSDYYSKQNSGANFPVDSVTHEDSDDIHLDYDFLRKFAHDMRTPLNSIQGFSKIMAQQNAESLAAQDLKDLESIQKNGLIIYLMLEKLMDYARIQRKEINLILKAVDLNQILKKTLRKMDVLAGSMGVSFEQISGEIPLLKTDETLLAKIMMYIIENSIYYSSIEQTRPVSVETEISEGGNVSILIKDFGVGMSEEELEACREPFYSGSLVQQKKFKGMGLGLYIAEEFLKEVNGKMKIESKVGEGTSVEIVLPIIN